MQGSRNSVLWRGQAPSKRLATRDSSQPLNSRMALYQVLMGDKHASQAGVP